MRVSLSLLTELAILGDEEANDMLGLWHREETSTLGSVEVYYYVDPIVDPRGYFYIHIPVPVKRFTTIQGLSEPNEDNGF
jgi:hypothetical protein